MECLRESSIEGRSGVIQCDAEGCEFRLHPHPDNSDAANRTPEVNRFLQLQLRAGSPENCSGVCAKYGTPGSAQEREVWNREYERQAREAHGIDTRHLFYGHPKE